MDRFYIITNTMKDRELMVTRKIAEYLTSHGKVCRVRDVAGEDRSGDYHYTDADQIPDDTECILVLGGDGTLLQAARDTVEKGIPLFGINLGTLGYLAEVGRKGIYPALDHLMEDRYEIEHRIMLNGKVYRRGVLLKEDIALNDIVISRSGAPRVVRFNNYINGTYLNSYSADGTIIATPTGSTGYSLSAGGPLISPAASLLLMTPLAPHTLNSRSVVFPSDDTITVEIGPGRDEREEHGMASFDGDTTVEMVTGDKIIISKSKKDTRIVKISNISFLETLREKMGNN